MSVKELFDLSGRKAIITGGSRGLGLQIASALGEQGAEVLLSARKADELDRAVAYLSGLGIRAHAIAADLGRPDEVARFAEKTRSTAETFGVGTRIAVPSSFPFSSGSTRPTAFAAPVEVGIIDRAAARPR